MADFLFVSQEMLDNWMMQGKIDFSGNVMTIRGDRRGYVLESAVRFVRVAGEGEDAAGLLGKVKSLHQVAELGGEYYHDSVILGETAYEVQTGFVARVSLPESAAAGAEGTASAPPPRAEVAAPAKAEPGAAPEPEAPTPSTRPAADAPAGPAEETEDEAVLLTRFLLDNMR